MLSKLKEYTIIKSQNYKKDNDYLSIIKQPKNKHDEIGAELLHNLYTLNVNFLITEDKIIHKNAIKLNLENNVFTINEFHELINPKDNIHSPKLVMKTVDELNSNDPIFDSLKEDYDEFDDWFKMIQEKHRPAFVYTHENNELGAVLIYKENEEEEIELKTKTLPKKKRLKIATLYVAESRNKIGESLLKNIFKKAIALNVDELYLTHFIKEDDVLVPFIEKYGFKLVGNNSRGEGVFIKNITFDSTKNDICDSNNAKISTECYPFYLDDERIDKYIVPITPEYYYSLFDTTQKTIDDYLENTFPEDLVQINAIQKAYISKSSTNLDKGDLLVFYESNKQGLKEIGIVTDFLKSNNIDEIKATIGKRSVFKEEELKEQINSLEGDSKLSVILFNHMESVNISYDILKDKIDFNAPQTTQKFSEEKYQIIKELI